MSNWIQASPIQSPPARSGHALAWDAAQRRVVLFGGEEPPGWFRKLDRDGNGVIFVSHRGEVYPAGFLPYPLLGNVKERALHEIYRESEALHEIQDPHNYRGRCGRCEFKFSCGGSRARAYAMTGDPLGEDPLCAYQPDAPEA